MVYLGKRMCWLLCHKKRKASGHLVVRPGFDLMAQEDQLILMNYSSTMG
ncbi:hypothetical protein C5167_046523 [Papaver somniferum]|uniref:Uncharacterized protein n=1 Tax=Papaver somniferum TaxID=3469 RepID=A0A4Y7LE03_PAPSO|nr:hypothetical protein C5167_046523 [Papaver somniferum]